MIDVILFFKINGRVGKKEFRGRVQRECPSINWIGPVRMEERVDHTKTIARADEPEHNIFIKSCCDYTPFPPRCQVLLLKETSKI